MGQLSAVSGGTAMAFQFPGSTSSGGGLTDDPGDPSLPAPPIHNLWIEMLQLFSTFKDRVYGTKPHFVVAGVQFTCITDEDPGTLGAGSGLMGAVSAISLEELASTKDGAQSNPLTHSSSISVANTASLFGGGVQHLGRDKEQVQGQTRSLEGAGLSAPGLGMQATKPESPPLSGASGCVSRVPLLDDCSHPASAQHVALDPAGPWGSKQLHCVASEYGSLVQL